MAKPTLVFVPGAWHSPEIYAATMEILNGHGYPTVGLPLASVGAEPPHISFDGDVQSIRDCLKRLVVTEEKEVILVSHSYSGLPAGEAPVDLGKKQREAKGLKGGMVRLVTIMGFAVPEGFQTAAAGAEFPYWMKLDAEKGVFNVEVEDAKTIFYNDISPEEGAAWAAKLRPQSAGVFSSTSTYAAWRYIPSTFVIGTEDKSTFTPEAVDFMLKAAREQVPSAFDVVETCQGGGHCLMISHPAWLAQVMRRAAGEEL